MRICSIQEQPHGSTNRAATLGGSIFFWSLAVLALPLAALRGIRNPRPRQIIVTIPAEPHGPRIRAVSGSGRLCRSLSHRIGCLLGRLPRQRGAGVGTPPQCLAEGVPVQPDGVR